MVGLVLFQGAKLAVVGVAIGVVAALGLTRLMTSLLYGVTANDPLTFAGVLIFLLLVADKSRVKLSRLHERHLFRALALHAISI